VQGEMGLDKERDGGVGTVERRRSAEKIVGLAIGERLRDRLVTLYQGKRWVGQ
jgi:hypothetical protein